MAQRGFYATYIDYTTTVSSSTGQIPMGACHTTLSGTAAQHRVTDRNTPADLKNLYVNVLTNANVNSTIVSVRKNGSVGNLSITVPASTTGVLTDLAGSDSIADGDTFNHTCQTFASATAFVAIVGVEWETAGQFAFQPAVGASAGLGFSTASSTFYMNPTGRMIMNTTENVSRVAAIGATTLSKLQIYVSANGRGTDTTFVSRNNGANGNQSITVAASATGLFEDTTHSDSVAAGDYFGIAGTTGTGAGTITLRYASYKMETGGNSYCPLWATNGFSLSANNTTQRSFIDAARTGGTPVPFAGHASNLYIEITTNTVSAPSSITLRKNGSNTALSASIPASTTGKFTDTSNVVAVAAGDLIDVEIAAGATGTTLTIRSYGVLIAADYAIAVTDSILPKIDDTSAVKANGTASDSITPKLDDVAAILVRASVSDSILPMLGEAVAVQVRQPVSDSISPKLDDAVTNLLVMLALADDLTPKIDDAGAASASLAVSDSVTPMLQDAAALRVAIAAADDITPRIDDVAAVLVSLAVNDGLALVLNDAASIRVLVQVADQLAINLQDVATSIRVIIAVADMLDVTLGEAVGIWALLDVSDSLGIKLDELASVIHIITEPGVLTGSISVASPFDASVSIASKLSGTVSASSALTGAISVEG